MKKFALIICTLVLVLASCKKKEFPENVTAEPEFYVKATIDGQPITLTAGTNGYYMHSSYAQTNDGLYSFIAEVKPQNCGSNCPNSLRIEFNDDVITTQGSNSNISSSIKPNITYEYANTSTVNPTIIGYMVTYSSTCNVPVDNYSWDFQSGPTATIANPTHTYAAPGVYDTRLTVGVGANYIHIENPIKVTTSPIAVRTRITATAQTGNSVSFGHVTTCSGLGNCDFLWEFGDGGTSFDITPTHVYSGASKWEATLTVIDHTWKDTAYHHYQINNNLSQQIAPNFYAASVQEILSNTPLKKIKITYTDGSGKVYSSDMQPQGGLNNFLITSVEEYKSNESGQSTKKLKVKFDCTLYNRDSIVQITNGEAVIAVAYK